MRSLLVIAFLAPALLAQTPRPKPYVTADQLDVKVLLAAPVPNETELPEVHRIQDTRTPADVRQAQADDAEEDMFVFKTVLGDKFNGASLPLTAALSARVHANEGVITNPAKAYFKRIRPFNFDHTVKPVCKVKDDPNDYGYPSGHSTSGYLEALVLIQIVPERRNEILARADAYAHNRVVCGVHYPSDTQASKLVAYATMGLMMNNVEFQRDLAAAKAETRRALFGGE
ncbi:MAG TPA: phosphatase PAP2 family protein [Bryobacteraceae bacterium]|nr:phosphatase PAP2 family protein [Bryobacteraceae bacterium]